MKKRTSPYLVSAAAFLTLTCLVGCEQPDGNTNNGQHDAASAISPSTGEEKKADRAADLASANKLVNSIDDQSTLGDRLVAVARTWQDQPYRVGSSEQCMNWTREILVQVCGAKFATLETQKPWDGHLLGPDDELLPEHVDSLAGDEFGEKIATIEQLQAGDLVFLKNTYGDWAPGVLTHVGIALGDGNYIHRMTSNKGLVKIEAIPAHEFDSGIRLKEALCPDNTSM